MKECVFKQYDNGNKEWRLDGKLHREDGPAFEWNSGSKEWWLNGRLHRENGPACQWHDGTYSWYLNGERMTEAEWNEAMNPVKEMTLAEICKAMGCNVKVIK